MADLHDLVTRTLKWEGDAAELEGIMADVSTWHGAQFYVIASSARHLLLKASSGGQLTKYQSALCHLYAVRGFTENERELYLEGVKNASDWHLEAWEPDAAAGILGDRPRVNELAVENKNLEM